MKSGSLMSSLTDLKLHIHSLFEVADNKMAMKLFGSKKALHSEKERHTLTGNWIIHPCSRFRFYWDLLMLLLLLTNLLVLPVVIAFFYDDTSIKWIVFNCVSDTLFLVDIVINFRTGVITNEVGNEIILDPHKIAIRYIKSWFFLDLISSIPVDYIFLMVSGNYEQRKFAYAERALRIFKLMKLLSLLRLLRLSRLVRYAHQWEEFLNMASIVMRILNLISLILLLGHWNGCLQFLVPMLQGFPDDCWVTINGLEEKEWFRQYTFSVFKALSHMLCIGYGRYPPINTADIWLTILSMVTGATCYAMFVGHITTLVQSFDTSKRLFREKSKQIQEYMFYRKIPMEMRGRVFDYFEYLYEGKCFNEQLILNEMNDCLRKEIIEFNCRNLIANVPFFTHTDPNFVTLVIDNLKFEIFLPGDQIVREGALGDRMFFIEQGDLDVITEEKGLITTLSEGSYFGEICLLANVHQRTATVRTEGYCCLWSLSEEHFNTILMQYPLVQKTMREVAVQRLLKMGKDPSIIRDFEMSSFEEEQVHEELKKILTGNTPAQSSKSAAKSLKFFGYN